MTPNAWPSQSLIDTNAFVRAAVEKPFYTYALTLLTVAPLHVVGILHSLVLLAKVLMRLLTAGGRQGSDGEEEDEVREERLVILAMWPAALLGGLTFVGCLGAGA